MVLCYHVMGSAKEVISTKEREIAFKELAKKISDGLMLLSCLDNLIGLEAFGKYL